MYENGDFVLLQNTFYAVHWGTQECRDSWGVQHSTGEYWTLAHQKTPKTECLNLMIKQYQGHNPKHR